MDKIIILDFGGQYCHLISRRVRDFGVSSEVKPASVTAAELSRIEGLRGIIFSGGARSVYEKNAPRCDPAILELGVPVLGICYGHQLIAKMLGGRVISGMSGEYGLATLAVEKRLGILAGLEKRESVWMNHRDVVSKLPKGFAALARTEHSKIAAYANLRMNVFGVQFHPEVRHTVHGDRILKNFVFNVCRCKKTQSPASLAGNIVREARQTIGRERAIIGLSGGIDSSVAAVLVHRAIGHKLLAVYVDTGLMRAGETDGLKRAFKRLRVNVRIVQAERQFFRSLKGVTSPERKRKIIGKLFVDVFAREAHRFGAAWLIQGTIYSDRIESGITKHSSIIKSHHNVGGLPKNLKLKLLEPLRDLYKDEVRKIARAIRLPDEVLDRQVFPGPGLAVRIIGEVTPERARIVREAGHIIEEELRKTKFWKRVWMSFAVLLPVKSVGVQGDERTYKYPVVVRIVESQDAMTANFSRLPYPILERISHRITNEVWEVNRVVYDITNKPPATMEWE